MTTKEYIYIPFNKSVNNYLHEMELISTGLFHVKTVLSKDNKTLSIEREDENLVSIIVNPVYAIITKLAESDIAKEIYETIKQNTKRVCN
ncbi:MULTISPECIES: hypothetical protein [unclassified Pedobacter]|uniref:hypothetical protein n=1 Tax=unclassified Pedobacter TaxID=2628915 RepID=UPI001E46F39A|nr:MULTISPECIES: hypothetical protein [unclassified Pedobacter]